MASQNLDGYTDYHGPSVLLKQASDRNDDVAGGDQYCTDAVPDNDDDETNPLRVGFWIEGDSLAPPCGSGIPVIHALLRLANVSEGDTVFDLGCGDGRVCLEAWVPRNRGGTFGARRCVGVECEEDLVRRFGDLVVRFGCEEAVIPVLGDLRVELENLLQQSVDRLRSLQKGEREIERDEWGLDLVICMYLLPEAIEMVRPYIVKLLRLGREYRHFISEHGDSHNRGERNNKDHHCYGVRIVCNTWGFMPSNEEIQFQLMPTKVLEVSIDGEQTETSDIRVELYLYTEDSCNK